MGQLRLPDGVEAGFRLVSVDEFGPVFTMHLYGAGRHGWFLLHSRYVRQDHEAGPHPLGKGEWRTFLGLVDSCRFWDLPEKLPDWDEIVSGRVAMDGWDSFDFAGRDGERYHHIQRLSVFESGLASVLRFCTRLSGLFDPPTSPGAESRTVAPDAESHSAPDRDGK